MANLFCGRKLYLDFAFLTRPVERGGTSTEQLNVVGEKRPGSTLEKGTMDVDTHTTEDGAV